jgi:hypothetical protein
MGKGNGSDEYEGFCRPYALGKYVDPETALLGAARIRDEAAAAGEPAAAATRYEERGRELLDEQDARVGPGHELTKIWTGSRGVLKDTLEKPDALTASASVRRMDLAHEAKALALGLDLAETIGARNSMEAMLAHQLAAVHRGSMKLMVQLDRETETLAVAVDAAHKEATNVRVARLVNATSRMMTTFQQGMLTLDRIRNGGRQIVHVEHHSAVQVNEGGQAIVAGQVGGTRRRKSRGGGDNK